MWSVVLFLLFSIAYSKIYFNEDYSEDFESRWVYSSDSSVTHGVFSRVKKAHAAGEDFCIKSMNDSSYYHMSSKLTGTLDTAVNDLYLMYVVRFEQNIDCGGGYLKLFSELDQKALTGNSPYSIMFGLDKCGYETQKIHFIVSHKGVNHQIKNKISVNIDTLPHFLELFIGTDGKFSVRMDGAEKSSGTLEDNFEYLPPKKIDDPKDKKPENWVDEETIDDPSDKKPEDWDERRHIPDPDAKKPSDWDDKNDGEWEPDLKPNPNYKGEWAPKKIPNPAFKGIWTPKQIDNPAYKPDNTFARFKLNYIGFDLWTVKSGTLFDRIFVTDDAKEAKEHSKVALDEVNAETEIIKKAEEEASKKKAEEAPKDPHGDGHDHDKEGEEEPNLTPESEEKHEDL